VYQKHWWCQRLFTKIFRKSCNHFVRNMYSFFWQKIS